MFCEVILLFFETLFVILGAIFLGLETIFLVLGTILVGKRSRALFIGEEYSEAVAFLLILLAENALDLQVPGK